MKIQSLQKKRKIKKKIEALALNPSILMQLQVQDIRSNKFMTLCYVEFTALVLHPLLRIPIGN